MQIPRSPSTCISFLAEATRSAHHVSWYSPAINTRQWKHASWWHPRILSSGRFRWRQQGTSAEARRPPAWVQCHSWEWPCILSRTSSGIWWSGLFGVICTTFSSAISNFQKRDLDLYDLGPPMPPSCHGTAQTSTYSCNV